MSKGTHNYLYFYYYMLTFLKLINLFLFSYSMLTFEELLIDSEKPQVIIFRLSYIKLTMASLTVGVLSYFSTASRVRHTLRLLAIMIR